MWGCRTLYVSQFLKKLTEPSTLLWITVQPPGSCLWSHHTCISRLAFSGFTRYMPLAVWPSSRACRQSLNGPEQKGDNKTVMAYRIQALNNSILKIKGVRLCYRESHFSAEALILTVELTLASPLTREMATGCAAKRNTGMRAKGILTSEWWNSSKNDQASAMLYSAGLLFHFHIGFLFYVIQTHNFQWWQTY